ncbi:LytR/AlgR family response regulator transcription factor [Cyclobacterium jeungdonense]|uniref:LytTR family DNA-binding domain-containing protein n=1 Tax=Cyclobacterium jeungdonense TaxID=708087 RepID=A0ABT8C5B0_9BACT|nr:LytTR family DNA-binding domain-containing protein [Cyclobacterium jeungdonense]MDN3687501.1 LytTR family DNA-binding domain-containing protein [Cyclobacterium jeungdonense]
MVNSLTVLIIEDEQIAAEKLESLLLETASDIRIMAKLGSIKESVRWLEQNRVDLIFLDIQLSDGISFSIFDWVEVSTPIIFTTAYDQYAIRAFQLNSISYLLKPIRKTDLIQSLQKYRDMKSALGIDFDSLLAQMQGRQPDYKKRFLIQIGEKIKKVDVEEVAYFFVLDKSIFIRTHDGSRFPLEYSLDKLEALLDPTYFFRINRKYLVHMDAISSMVAYSRGRVKLELNPKTEDPFDAIVSIDRSADFKKWLNS